MAWDDGEKSGHRLLTVICHSCLAGAEAQSIDAHQSTNPANILCHRGAMDPVHLYGGSRFFMTHMNWVPRRLPLPRHKHNIPHRVYAGPAKLPALSGKLICKSCLGEVAADKEEEARRFKDYI